MYIDLSALPLTLLKRFDTNVHTVITSMQKKPLFFLSLAVLPNGTNRSILGLSFLQGLPVVLRLNLPKKHIFTNTPRHAGRTSN